MEYALIVVALGIILIIWEYRTATAPDPKDKLKRRKSLDLPDKVRLRGLIFVTFMLALGVWWATWFFD
ncbi:MAG: hypothetical protein ACREUW_08975 [Burkholderiales bacterium]